MLLHNDFALQFCFAKSCGPAARGFHGMKNLQVSEIVVVESLWGKGSGVTHRNFLQYSLNENQ